jgi:RimJ/RimL family protein N-acetyltransferase
MREFFLSTDRVKFSYWQSSDLNLAKILWSDKDVARFISAGGIFNDDEIFKRLNLEIDNFLHYNMQYWPVFLKGGEEFIGCCGLRPYGEDIEFGVHLLPAYWGIGIAYECGTCIIEYAKSNFPLKDIYAGHNPLNTNSGKLLKKLGFNFLKTEFYEPTGLMHPTYVIKMK